MPVTQCQFQGVLKESMDLLDPTGKPISKLGRPKLEYLPGENHDAFLYDNPPPPGSKWRPDFWRLTWGKGAIYLSGLPVTYAPRTLGFIKQFEAERSGRHATEKNLAVPFQVGIQRNERIRISFIPVPRRDENPNVTAFYVDEETMGYLKFTPSHWLADILYSEDMKGKSMHDAQCAIRAIAAFRSRAKRWIELNLDMGRGMFETCEWLPLKRIRGLDDYLFRYVKSQPLLLHMIASIWEKHGPFSKAPKRVIEENQGKLLDGYVVKNKSLATDALTCGMGSGEYARLEKRWLKSLDQPSRMPSFRMESGELVGRFLPRNDPRGLFLGLYSGCCQYPGAAAGSSAWHGQESPNGGFLVMERKGRIVGQSWVWINDQLVWSGLSPVAVLDSLEVNRITKEEASSISKILSGAAEALLGTGVREVLLGSVGEDVRKMLDVPVLGTSPCPPTPFISVPADEREDLTKRSLVLPLCYTDVKKGRELEVIASSSLLPRTPPISPSCSTP